MNSSMGSSSGLGRPRGAGAAAICVVDTLTTIGWSFLASVTKSGDPLDGGELLFAKNPSEPSVFLPEQPNPTPVTKNSVNTIAALRIISLLAGKQNILEAIEISFAPIMINRLNPLSMPHLV